MVVTKKRILVVIFIIIGVAATSGLIYWRAKSRLKFLLSAEGQKQMAEKEVADITAKLHKLAVLPEESPVIATIINNQVLATQSAFYKDARNGDKLVIFAQAQKAYLYRPSTNLIVNFGPLESNEAKATPAPRTDFSIEVRNGTKITGLAKKTADLLKGQGFTRVTTGAADNDYKENLVFAGDPNVTEAELDKIALLVEGKVTRELASGESSPAAQVLVILGQ